MALEFVETVASRGQSETSESVNHVRKSLGVYPEPRFNYAETDQEFAFAHEAADFGKDLIRKHHSFLEVYEIRVEYVFLKNTPVKNGREILGRAKKVSGLNAWLAMPEKTRLNQLKPDVFFCYRNRLGMLAADAENKTHRAR